MKTRLTLLTCLFFLSPNVVQSETVQLETLVKRLLRAQDVVIGTTMDDLVHRDGLYYKKFTDIKICGGRAHNRGATDVRPDTFVRSCDRQMIDHYQFPSKGQIGRLTF